MMKTDKYTTLKDAVALYNIEEALDLTASDTDKLEALWNEGWRFAELTVTFQDGGTVTVSTQDMKAVFQ